MAEPVRYAGFWIRVASSVLDVLILGALNMAVTLAVVVWATFTEPGPGIGSVSVGYEEVSIEFGLVMPPLLIVGSWIGFAASPGKMLLGLRIVDEPSGGRPTVWQCLGRYVMAVVSLACVGLGYFYIAIDPRKQGWHDKIVRTLVVRRGSAT
jgi:uncharacterized RDD family membrane protein YckC